ncbi:hypothetical protein Salat_0633800 [Sesamum alatum]|uniref:Uncharacterized protein n=1 Tax=Sesamum alatum TaxID=300844 RepID=A0AAE1YQY0_9LAMI|nr:hypothetical protein Salat_0633800 [Sesamum alatum]
MQPHAPNPHSAVHSRRAFVDSIAVAMHDFRSTMDAGVAIAEQQQTTKPQKIRQQLSPQLSILTERSPNPLFIVVAITNPPTKIHPLLNLAKRNSWFVGCFTSPPPPPPKPPIILIPIFLLYYDKANTTFCTLHTTPPNRASLFRTLTNNHSPQPIGSPPLRHPTSSSKEPKGPFSFSRRSAL